MMSAAPTVVVRVTTVPALDACLAALDATLPSGTAVWIDDDAGGDPRVGEWALRWCRRTGLSGRYRRRERPLGRARQTAALLHECGDSDLVLLDAGAVPAPGWMQRLQDGLRARPDAAMLSAWGNSAGLCSFPRIGEDNPLPASLADIAAACARLGESELPPLPSPQGPCLYLRAQVARQLGGLDTETFAELGAEADLAYRARAMGWLVALCPTAFVGSSEPARQEPAGEDRRHLCARWPEYQADFARFILSDPLRAWRQRVAENLARQAEEQRVGGPQGELFA
jgi:hypothetical protein